MKRNQANAGQKQRLMYVENKDGEIDGHVARIGWVHFSKSGLSIHYRNRTFQRSKGQGIRGNYRDAPTGDEYWISGLKVRGSNVHWAESVRVRVDDDAGQAYGVFRAEGKAGTVR